MSAPSAVDPNNVGNHNADVIVQQPNLSASAPSAVPPKTPFHNKGSSDEIGEVITTKSISCWVSTPNVVCVDESHDSVERENQARQTHERKIVM